MFRILLTRPRNIRRLSLPMLMLESSVCVCVLARGVCLSFRNSRHRSFFDILIRGGRAPVTRDEFCVSLFLYYIDLNGEDFYLVGGRS